MLAVLIVRDAMRQTDIAADATPDIIAMEQDAMLVMSLIVQDTLQGVHAKPVRQIMNLTAMGAVNRAF